MCRRALSEIEICTLSEIALKVGERCEDFGSLSIAFLFVVNYGKGIACVIGSRSSMCC